MVPMMTKLHFRLLIPVLLALTGAVVAAEPIPGLVECDKVAELGLPQPATTGTSGLSPALQATYERTCRMCHANEGTGAPRTGDADAWQPRLAQGRELLLDHTINGYQTMPPLGLCMACTEEQFVQLIEFMAGRKLP